MENKHIYQDWLTLSQCSDTRISLACFKEVEKHYTHPSRHYHTLIHIYNLFNEIKNLRCSEIEKQLLAHAALFHDVIYSTTAKDNEFQSAQFAIGWLDSLGIDKENQKIITQLIIATATHTSNDHLAQLFIDMDMSILGSTHKRYHKYCSAIRKEYKNIPLLLYKRGRKRFLQDLLNRKYIFLTTAYQLRFEKQARINIHEELKMF